MTEEDMICRKRGDQPPIMYDGCSIWAAYWLDRGGVTLQVFDAGEKSKLSVGSTKNLLANLEHEFPLDDVLDLLREAGYEITAYKDRTQKSRDEHNSKIGKP